MLSLLHVGFVMKVIHTLRAFCNTFLFMFPPLSVATFLLNPNSEQIRAGGSNFPFFGAETQQVGKKVPFLSAGEAVRW